MINKENIEQWMFDYTEGNLSPDHQKELIHFIEENPRYKEDLNLWAMSYIKAPLPEVNFKKLSVRQNRFRKYFKVVCFGTFVLSGAIITLLYYSNKKLQPAIKTVVKERHIYHHKTDASPNNILSEKQAPESEHNQPQRDDKKTVVKPATILPEMSKADGAFMHDTAFVPADTTALTGLPESTVQKSDTSSASPLKSFPKEIKNNSLTKKELREIEKAKSKAIQKRKEEELMKGNKPYVVPFNNGF
jgi:hypothetical protein